LLLATNGIRYVLAALGSVRLSPFIG